MSEQELEEKQDYLRNEILDKGYNGEEFMNFLISKKGDDGSDINNWTMDELRIVTAEFQNQFSANQPVVQEEQNYNENQQYYPQPQEQPENNEPVTPPPKVEEKKQAPRKKCTMFGEDFNVQRSTNNQTPSTTPATTPVVQPKVEPKPRVEQKITTPPTSNKKPQTQPQEPQIEEIQCKCPERSKLSSFDDLKITLSFPERAPEHTGFKGVFSKKKYISYQVETAPIGLICRRRYSDFEWLRSVLIKLYPGIYIPPLPRKTLDDSASDTKVEKRMRMLTRFINSLVEDPLLKNSEVLYDFLSSAKRKPLEDELDKYKNLENDLSLNNVHTRSGKIIIDKSIDQNDKYFNGINDNMKNNVSELSKLSKNFKLLFQEISAVNKRYLEISKIFNSLYTMSMANGENENLIKSYSNMKFLMEGLGFNELKLAKNIDLEVREYFKYVKHEYYSCQELYDQYYYSRNLSRKNYESLMKKKENLYNKHDVSKWEMDPNETVDINNKFDCFSKMMKKETIINNNLRNNYLYLANQCKYEFIRIREVVGFQNREKMKSFFDNNKKVVDELNKLWDKFGSNLEANF